MCLTLMLSDNNVQNILEGKKGGEGRAAWNLLSLLLKRTTLRFFFLKKTVVNKRKIYTDIYLYTQRYTLSIFNAAYVLYRYTQKHKSVYTYTHTPNPYIQYVNINVFLGVSLESVYYQMMIKYLICFTPEKILEGNDSSDALWNGTIT